MARKVAFDRDIVIQQAMLLFQEKGYEATSIRDLVAHLGVSSSSLYSSFGDKDALFMLALERHSQIEMAGLQAQLAADSPSQTILTDLFDNLIERLLRDGFPSDSLTLKAATELSVRKPVVAEFLGRYLDEMTAVFAQFLDGAVADGQLSLTRPSADMARYLLFALYNLNLMVKIYPERSKLEGYKAMVLQSVLHG